MDLKNFYACALIYIISTHRPDLKTGMDFRPCLKTGVENFIFGGMKSGQDLENRVAQPHQ